MQFEAEHTRYAPYADDMSRGLNRLGASVSSGILAGFEFRLTSDWLMKDAQTFNRSMLSVGHYY